jgi:hypothetical protein
VEVKSYVVESSTGERRTALADRERTRLLEHFAALRMHVAALARQVVQLGGTPCGIPTTTLGDATEAAAYLAADMEARPVTSEDVGAWRRPSRSRSRDEVAASSTRSRIEAFLRARGGEHTRKDLAAALGVSTAAVSVAISKSNGLFTKRATRNEQRGVRVLYRLVEDVDADAVAE